MRSDGVIFFLQRKKQSGTLRNPQVQKDDFPPSPTRNLRTDRDGKSTGEDCGIEVFDLSQS